MNQILVFLLATLALIGAFTLAMIGPDDQLTGVGVTGFLGVAGAVVACHRRKEDK